MMLTTPRPSLNFAKSYFCRAGRTKIIPRRELENTLLSSSNHAASFRSWADVAQSNGIPSPYFHKHELKRDQSSACHSRRDLARALPCWSQSRGHQGYALVPQTGCLPGNTLLCRLLGDPASTTSSVTPANYNSLCGSLSPQPTLLDAVSFRRHLPIRVGRSCSGRWHQSLPLHSRRPITGP